MKKIAIYGGAGAFLVAMALLAWPHCWLSNAEVYRRLTGTWVVPWANDPKIQSRITFSPGGSYVCQITGFTNGAIVKLAGKWQVKNGGFLDTVTNLTSTNLTVPTVMSGRILRLNASELVAKWDVYPEESAARRVVDSSTGPAR